MNYETHIAPGLPGETSDRNVRRGRTVTPGKPGAKCGRGFTLVEMIVVVCIIALLLSLLLAAVVRARAFAEKSSIQAYMGHLSGAIDAYYADFGMYPDSSSANTYSGGTPSGGSRLAQALMGYINLPIGSGGDGAGPAVNATDPKYGFRMNPSGQGRIYGPYMQINANSYLVVTAGLEEYFTDPLGQIILYFRASRNTAATQYFASSGGIFNQADNPVATYGDPTTTANKLFLTLLGNTGGGTPASAGNNTINAGETPINQSTYLLVSPGINGTANSNNWYTGGTGLYDSVVNSN